MTELKRHIGLFHLTMYGVGLILGAGIYVLIGEAASYAGNALWISFALGSVVAIFAGLSYAELSALFPRAAAEYTFVKEAFRNEFLGYIIGWLTAITSIITAATVALGFGGYFQELTGVPIVISSILILGILSLVNFIGIRESTWFNTIFAVITALGLILIIFLGFLSNQDNVEIDYYQSPLGTEGIIIAFILVFFAFIGFEDIANVAEEVKNPRKTIPKGIILSVIITGFIYILVSISAIQIVGWEKLSESSAPLALVAEKRLGDEGHFFLSIIALFATASTILITLIAGSRMFYGLARDGVFPKKLGTIHSKSSTPWIAIVGIFLCSMAFAFVGDIVIVANITIFAVVITFAMVNLSVIVLRYTQPNLARPFRVPLNVKNFPVLPLFGLGTTIYMAINFEIEIILVGILIIGIGIIFYFTFKKSKLKK